MSYEWIDITAGVEYGRPEEEHLPLLACICGESFRAWTEFVGKNSSDPWQCPECGVKLIFGQQIKVLMLKESDV